MNYLKFVNKVVSNYEGRGVEREDLIQSALVGLLEAELRWDEDSDVSFSTMAYRYAKNEINQLLYRQTKKDGIPVRLCRNKEVPFSDIEEEKVTEDRNEALKFLDEVFDKAGGVLQDDEMVFFTNMYEEGERAAVRYYMQEHGVSRHVAYKVRDIIRKKVKEVIV